MAISFGRIGTLRIQTCLMLAYFLATPVCSIATGVIGELPAILMVNFAIAFFLILTAYEKASKKWFFPILIYSCVVVFMISTILIHPDYRDWYIHETYGIRRAFLDLRSGITALLIFSMYDDEEELISDLKISAIFVFLAYFYKYLMAMRRGYWIIGTVSGGQMHAAYDMEFGYRILFPAAVFGAEGIIKGNRKELLFYLFCVMLILTGGSRGPALWAMCVVPVALLFRFGKLSYKKKRILICAIVILAALLIFMLLEKNLFIALAAQILNALGIHSRTLDAMLSGTIADANGRDIIYGIAIDLIKDGGPFGHGFYGDRPVIGQRFRWGYSHNIFLELFVQFGYVGGLLISSVLIWNLVRLFKNSNSTNRQVITATVIVCSMRLLLSNSFWYEPWFWAIIALFFWFNKSKANLTSSEASREIDG